MLNRRAFLLTTVAAGAASTLPAFAAEGADLDRLFDQLFQEGLRMHHCVVTYKDDCVSGECSIWSLTSEYPIGRRNRGVTIELRNDGRIVQCRGFANRLPYANEVAICRRWAEDNGLTWKALGG